MGRFRRWNENYKKKWKRNAIKTQRIHKIIEKIWNTQRVFILERSKDSAQKIVYTLEDLKWE